MRPGVGEASHRGGGHPTMVDTTEQEGIEFAFR